ncbi:hypothetical protein I532_09242 [Brevibacillus borstelensis AK1]|uniref:DUF1294 domain-containing protein n=1 Tax=Brevibacillus borstelensis AK1 TaxID=1300222 RepID=M8DHP1_9BACL|nr:DUF1294 domain-containing protein [Brevibacillus borstelensis]EMT52952.1 hypothetical protein I532_09242 [Brevibacillus borstelensis AK1]KKX55634.1 hypothetical protein X546_08190 [Brevibacillus borstelensis cifa_chp40]
MNNQHHLETYKRVRNALLACTWLMIGYGWWSQKLLWLLAGIILVNVYAFMVTANDKRYAKQGRLRIPESGLLLVAALGGAAGTWAGMLFFRHKTKHLSFTIPVPVFFIIQMYLLFLAIRYILKWSALS